LGKEFDLGDVFDIVISYVYKVRLLDSE